MFMRSVLSDEATVGLLLFDEPSASLDPTAEHGKSRFPSVEPVIDLAKICSDDCVSYVGTRR